ncbi:MAG: phosphatidate cytidylyltransferase [Pseudobutyrivibrio sp.]|nr:phosphatidate cytidylyltransferase [Pseudobutyrivibrio sp.]
MFKTRLISGIILVILLVFFVGYGGYPLLASTLFLSLVGMFELYRVFKIEKSLPAIAGYIICFIYYFVLAFSSGAYLPNVNEAIFVGFLIALLGVYVFSYPKYKASDILQAFFGFFYVAVMLSYIFIGRMGTDGKYIIWLVFLCSWGCDTCAYCVGKLFGKHKMSPILSPKKSVEGAVGGVIGAMLLTALYSFIMTKVDPAYQLNTLYLAIVAGVGALISMVGDLAASAIKRNYEIKDYGTLIPGHGGVLDRFDSVIITAPIIYFLAYYFYI